MSQGFVNAQNIALPLAVAEGGTGQTSSTGSGAVVLATSPTITTPGIVGVTDAGNATTGHVGEYLETILLVGSAVSLTSLAAANVTSLALTAGDWDIWGTVWYDAAGTTVASSFAGAINTVSATFPTVPAAGTSYQCWYFSPIAQASAGVEAGVVVSPARVTISGTTTYYLIARSGFGTSTLTAYGKICARRVR